MKTILSMLLLLSLLGCADRMVLTTYRTEEVMMDGHKTRILIEETRTYTHADDCEKCRPGSK